MKGTFFTMDTIAGPKKFACPEGWTWDDTAKRCWYWLVTKTRERWKSKLKRKRDEYELDASIRTLAVVLANALGMAPGYWMDAAKELMNAKV
jgi:hypothetical protein